MSFSEDEIQLITSKVDKAQANARKRTVFAIVVPTIAAILYLGFTAWIINIRQGELKELKALKDIEVKTLNEKKEQLAQAEKKLKKTEEAWSKLNEQVIQAQRKYAEGKGVAAQEQIVKISTDFTKNEIDGFGAILEGDLGNARRLFGIVYNAYPTYHNVDEIYKQLLTKDRVSTYNAASPKDKEAIQRSVMKEIVTNYSWGVPDNLLNQMKAKLAS